MIGGGEDVINVDKSAASWFVSRLPLWSLQVVSSPNSNVPSIPSLMNASTRPMTCIVPRKKRFVSGLMNICDCQNVVMVSYKSKNSNNSKPILCRIVVYLDSKSASACCCCCSEDVASDVTDQPYNLVCSNVILIRVQHSPNRNW